MFIEGSSLFFISSYVLIYVKEVLTFVESEEYLLELYLGVASLSIRFLLPRL